MASEDDGSAQSKITIDLRRTDDFTSRYANNLQLEPTLWDLKLTFGETDQKISAGTVVQHTAITVSWAEAKVIAYFINSHVASHEAQVGRIVLIPDIIQPPPEEIPSSVPAAKHPMWKKAYAAMNKLYQEFIHANPESAPVTSVKSKHSHEN